MDPSRSKEQHSPAPKAGSRLPAGNNSATPTTPAPFRTGGRRHSGIITPAWMIKDNLKYGFNPPEFGIPIKTARNKPKRSLRSLPSSSRGPNTDTSSDVGLQSTTFSGKVNRRGRPTVGGLTTLPSPSGSGKRKAPADTERSPVSAGSHKKAKSSEDGTIFSDEEHMASR